MSTGTHTKTVATVEARDVGRVSSLVMEEIKTLLQLLHRADCGYDTEKIEEDIALFSMFEIITAVKLQWHLPSMELICEYTFQIADHPMEAYGPPPTRPPLPELLSGAELRLVVTPNAVKAQSERDQWFRRRSWREVQPLTVPNDAVCNAYGAYASGNYAVERSLTTTGHCRKRPVTADAELGAERRGR